MAFAETGWNSRKMLPRSGTSDRHLPGTPQTYHVVRYFTTRLSTAYRVGQSEKDARNASSSRVKNSGKLIYCLSTEGDAENLVMRLYGCEKETNAKRSTSNRLEEIDHKEHNFRKSDKTKNQEVRSEVRR